MAASLREEVRKRLASGETPRSIATALGITTQAVYLHMEALRRAAVEAKTAERSHSPVDTNPKNIYGAKRGVGVTRTMVLALVRQGKSVREIARTTDVSEVAVRKHLRKLRELGELVEVAS